MVQLVHVLLAYNAEETLFQVSAPACVTILTL